MHDALGKIIIDTNNNPEHFLTTNPYYDSLVGLRLRVGGCVWRGGWRAVLLLLLLTDTAGVCWVLWWLGQVGNR